MIAIIRISGIVNRKEEIENTLNRLRLRRKYSCVVLDKTKEIMGMVEKVRSNVAYGEINEKTLEELVEKRAKPLSLINSKKIDTKKIVKEILDKKTVESLEIKPFFRLHPPLKGINTKQHFPKGVLGDNKDKINNLILRML